MSEVANIYDNGPISPVAQIHENLAVWTSNEWKYYKILFVEPLPYSNPFIFNFCNANQPQIAANAAVNQQILAILQMQENELLHVRWSPIDDIWGSLFELAQAARFSSRGIHANVTLFTRLFDPWLCTTTFFVMGQNNDAQIQCINPNPVLIWSARMAFWGYRYILDQYPPGSKPANARMLPAQAMTGYMK